MLQPTSAPDRATSTDAIDSLRTGGGTNMGSGMDLAYGMVAEVVSSARRPGRSEDQELLGLVERAADRAGETSGVAVR